jgi:aryl-alcohol dehydrogenase-like predicted oxidoreductase
MIAFCEKHNMAAINRGPLAMGLLTGKYGPDTKIPADDVRGKKSPGWMKYFKNGKPSPDWMSMRDATLDILTSNGRTVAQGALAWIWARTTQTIPIPGFRTVKQVEENARAMEFGPLTQEQMSRIEIILHR